MPRLIIPTPTFDQGVLFRRSLAAKLGDFRRDGRGRRASLSGVITHAGGASRIVISRFHNPLSLAPSVDCDEPWIRRTPSWHYEHHNSRFCWVLQDEWVKHFKDRKNAGEPVGVRCQDAASWLIQAMEIVLSRHWIGHRVGLFEWPEEWEDYAHGEDGVKEFHEGKFNNDVSA